jgi:5'-3' exonuclease
MSKNKYAELLSGINNDPRSKNSSVLVIDGLNTFLRSFTMINHINPNGHHIGGLTGFLKSIGYAIKQLDPTRVIITFDGVGGSNARRNLFPDYKANRNVNRMTNYSIFSSKDEESESIAQQMERLIVYLKCLPVTLICVDAIEADDVIAKLVEKYEQDEECRRIHIMSADQDFLQLVTNKTHVYSPVKKKIYTPSLVLEEYNLTSKNFIIKKILMGDKSDNVPGVSGLGDKKLAKLYPELMTEQQMTLQDVIKIAAEKINEHQLYASIIERSHQLHINERIMSLHHLPLSDENIAEIEDALENANTGIDKKQFLGTYYVDNLGNSIPNVENWLNEVFGGLSNFK